MPADSVHSSDRATTAVTTLAIASLFFFALLRLYAITQPVAKAWDDSNYRDWVMNDLPKTTLLGAAKGVLLPNSNIIAFRSIGYHSWLVLTAKVFVAWPPEVAWQIANAILLLFQAVAVCYLAVWATGDWPFSLSFTFLYLSAPIVFGINRWVLTENHYMAAMLVMSAGAAAIVSDTVSPAECDWRRWLWREIVKVALITCVLGILITLREPAIPYAMMIYACVGLGLLRERRWAACAVFMAVILPYFSAFTQTLLFLAARVRHKLAEDQYFHSLSEWIPRAFTYAAGPALSLFLLVATPAVLILIALAAWSFAESEERGNLLRALQTNVRGIHILLAGHAALFAAYCVSFVFSQNRVIRPAILHTITAVCVTLIGFQVFRKPLWPGWRRARLTMIPLMLLSWCVLLYQLLFAFDGGRTYVVYPDDMEYYNYPLGIRTLHGPYDSHTTTTLRYKSSESKWR